MKRSLYLWHRYLGIGLSLLFALWFVSGVVMLYARFPILTPEDRFPLLSQFQPNQFVLTPQEALDRAAIEGNPRRVRLGVLLDRPTYYILPAGKPWVGVYADNGEALGPWTRASHATSYVAMCRMALNRSTWVSSRGLTSGH